MPQIWLAYIASIYYLVEEKPPYMQAGKSSRYRNTQFSMQYKYSFATNQDSKRLPKQGSAKVNLVKEKIICISISLTWWTATENCNALCRDAIDNAVLIKNYQSTIEYAVIVRYSYDCMLCNVIPSLHIQYNKMQDIPNHQTIQFSEINNFLLPQI